MLDRETLDQLLDTIRRFVRERLVPNEERIAEEDAIPNPSWRISETISGVAVERFYRDVRLFRLYEGASQIQQLVIARAMMREASEG